MTVEMESAGLEHKFCRFDGAVTVEDGHKIEGYASLFNIADQGGDIVGRGAYEKALVELAKSGRRVKMLWQHNPAEPIGIWDEIREDDTGLWVSGRILPDVQRGREAAVLLEAGAIDGLSIGYRAKKVEKTPTGQRKLLEIDLWEVSLVTFPMLPQARVGAKSEATEAHLAEALAQTLTAARAELRRR